MPTKEHHISERIAVWGMVLAAILWGFSYPLTKYVENCPTYYIIAIRFAIAAILLAIIFHKNFKNMNKDIIKYAFLLSFAIFLMYAFGTWGIKYTTAVRSSFFTTLSFLIIPIINWMVYKVKISKVILFSALICLVGMFLLCYSPDMGNLVINLGDILCTLAALAGSIHILFVATVSKKETIDPSLFTVFLMGFVSIWGFVMALFGGEMSYQAQTSELVVIVLLGIFCSAFAFFLQSHLEAIVPPNRVGIIISLEPASGCILSVLLIHETMAWTGWLGAAIIIASCIYMEVANSKEEEKKQLAEG